MLFGAAPMSDVTNTDIKSAFSTKASALEATGQIGENVFYRFDESTGILTVYGTGKTYEYSQIICLRLL